jgi:hypothetical protein
MSPIGEADVLAVARPRPDQDEVSRRQLRKQSAGGRRLGCFGREQAPAGKTLPCGDSVKRLMERDLRLAGQQPGLTLQMVDGRDHRKTSWCEQFSQPRLMPCARTVGSVIG